MLNFFFQNKKKNFDKRLFFFKNKLFGLKKLKPLLFLKKKKTKIGLFLQISIFFIFFYKNTIFLKRFFYFFIKYNSFKRHKNLISLFYFFLKNLFYAFNLGGGAASCVQFKGRISSRGSSKKKKITKTFGSFYDNRKKSLFLDQKPSSGKQGCVNLRLIFKLSKMFLKVIKKRTKPVFFFVKKKKKSNFFFFTGNLNFKSSIFLKKKTTSTLLMSPLTSQTCQGFFFFLKNNSFFSFFFKKNNFMFLLNSIPFSIINEVRSFLNNKILYKSSSGTFLVFKGFSLKKKLITFILPSGATLITNLFVFGFFGKNLNKLVKGSFNSLFKFGKKKKIVKGVCMNPVDHHNGGRSNRKPLFLNKYNNIAKCNKKC